MFDQCSFRDANSVHKRLKASHTSPGNGSEPSYNAPPDAGSGKARAFAGDSSSGAEDAQFRKHQNLFRLVFERFEHLGRLLLTPEERDPRSNIHLKFWESWTLFADNITTQFVNSHDLSKDDMYDSISINFAPQRLLKVAQTLCDYRYSRQSYFQQRQGAVEIPDGLRRGYQQVILAFLHGAKPWTEENVSASRRCFNNARRDLKESFYETLSLLPQPPLIMKEAVNVRSFFALLLRSCIYSIPPTKQDVIGIYSHQLTALVCRQTECTTVRKTLSAADSTYRSKKYGAASQAVSRSSPYGL